MSQSEIVDSYIAAADQWSAELAKVRGILNSTELNEEVKWGAPCYTFNGKNVVGLAGFKSYFGLWFHQGALLKDDDGVLLNAQEGATRALRQWRMNSARDIKAAVIKRYVREAIELVRDGKSIAPTRKKPLVVPPELQQALGKSKAAQEKFLAMTLGKQREYAEYVSSAKQAATKLRRLEKILPLIVDGVGLNDKYRSS